MGKEMANAIPPNTYLYVLAEVGVVGFAVFAWLVLAYLKRLRTAYRRLEGAPSQYVFAAYLSTTGLLVAGIVHDIKTLFSYFPVFGMYLAMARLLENDGARVNDGRAT